MYTLAQGVHLTAFHSRNLKIANRILEIITIKKFDKVSKLTKARDRHVALLFYYAISSCIKR